STDTAITTYKRHTYCYFLTDVIKVSSKKDAEEERDKEMLQKCSSQVLETRQKKLCKSDTGGRLQSQYLRQQCSFFF
ncbi:unnamed protein product, partial [Amoebophrya sp. A120]